MENKYIRIDDPLRTNRECYKREGDTSGDYYIRYRRTGKRIISNGTLREYQYDQYQRVRKSKYIEAREKKRQIVKRLTGISYPDNEFLEKLEAFIDANLPK